MNIVLCGLPGSGKTTVGKALAERLGRKLIDTDTLIEQLERESCRAIYMNRGEENFRIIENRVVQLLEFAEDRIIATGGGTLLLGQNITALKRLGPLVYLQGETDFLYSRVSAKAPPAYLDLKQPEQTFAALARQRSLIFDTWADFTICVERMTPEEIAEQIEERYGL